MEVSIYGLFEVFNLGMVPEGDNVTIFHVNVELMLLGEVVKFVLEVLPIFNVSIKAKDGPFLEVDRLVDKLVEDPGVVKSLEGVVVGVNN